MRLLRILLILGVVAALTWNLYEHYAQDKNTCTYCGDLIWEEGTQIREYWLHDRCWSILALEYGWYEESNAKVIDEICEELERRTPKNK